MCSTKFSYGIPSLVAAALALGGCMVGPDYRTPNLPVPESWQAPKPHQANNENLLDWWQQFDDPVLTELVSLAENDSPTLEQAYASIVQARSTLTSSRAAALPEASGSVSKSRSRQTLENISAISESTSAGLDASWEIDLFGKLRRASQAARARVEARIDDWHDARVSLAAEVADTYVQYRGCRQLVNLYEQQLASLRETARVTQIAQAAGFTSPADAALISASRASSNSTFIDQRSECDLLRKSLVELTGASEPRLVELLDTPGEERLPEPAGLTVTAVPADLLRQRPDLASSERELAAANAEVGEAIANRFPSLSLTGSIAIGLDSDTSRTWSIGPSLSVPLFDAGERRAAVTSAQAAYDSAVAGYRQSLRTVVLEVEQALVNLDAARRREGESEEAAQGYQAYFEAIDRYWEAGGVSLLDREDARRQALDQQIELVTLRQNQVRYWIALYKALGGGWRVEQNTASQPPAMQNGETL